MGTSLCVKMKKFTHTPKNASFDGNSQPVIKKNQGLKAETSIAYMKIQKRASEGDPKRM